MDIQTDTPLDPFWTRDFNYLAVVPTSIGEHKEECGGLSTRRGTRLSVDFSIRSRCYYTAHVIRKVLTPGIIWRNIPERNLPDHNLYQVVLFNPPEPSKSKVRSYGWKIGSVHIFTVCNNAFVYHSFWKHFSLRKTKYIDVLSEIKLAQETQDWSKLCEVRSLRHYCFTAFFYAPYSSKFHLLSLKSKIKVYPFSKGVPKFLNNVDLSITKVSQFKLAKDKFYNNTLAKTSNIGNNTRKSSRIENDYMHL